MSTDKQTIRRLLTILAITFVALCDLTAQTAKDSLSIRPSNGLIEAFEEVSFEDGLPQYFEADSLNAFDSDSLLSSYAREIVDDLDEEYRVDRYFENFNPTPAKAVWMAALIPGGGQIYNRKYWKLPIVYGGFLGLVYGYNWNQRYYKTYQNAYRDLMTNSPNASYLQFMPGKTLKDKQAYASTHGNYLETTFTRKRNTYRNWRDYCVVGMLGVYLVSIVDAYVDAALYHFDVSPELDACNNPSMVVSYRLEF